MRLLRYLFTDRQSRQAGRKLFAPIEIKGIHVMNQGVARYFSALSISVLVIGGASCGTRKKGHDDNGNIHNREEQTQTPSRGNPPATPASKDTIDSTNPGPVKSSDTHPSRPDELKTFIRIREATTPDGMKANAVLFGIRSDQGRLTNDGMTAPPFLSKVISSTNELNQQILANLFQHTQPPYSSDERASLLAEFGGSLFSYTEAYPGRLCDGKAHRVDWSTSQGDYHQKTTFKFVAHAADKGDCDFTLLSVATAGGGVAISTSGDD